MTPDYRAGLLRAAEIAASFHVPGGTIACLTIAEAIEREASHPATVPDAREKCRACGWRNCPACNGTGTAGDKP